MKKLIKQNGRTITSLDELEDNIPVRVSNTYTIDDLPYSIEISTGVAVRREVLVNMVREFAQEQKIAAVKWVRQIMNWGLKEAKEFVDSLMEEPNLELSETDIEQWVGIAAFERGYDYFTKEYIYSPSRCGNTFKGRCQGSEDRVYSVEATLINMEIVSSSCSCPVRRRGCKHVAALLLAWVHEPDLFVG